MRARVTLEIENSITMSANSIGIQVIMPKTGTSSQQQPQQQADARGDDVHAPRQAPPPPGMGKLVDKLV